MRMKGLAVVAMAIVAGAGSAMASDAVDVKGEVGLEGRTFFQDPVDGRQTDGDLSLRLLPELYTEWNDRSTAATFSPFARLDSADAERTHWDIREAYLRHRFGDIEARVGVRKVFWGATESVHLVDIINQTDLVENPDAEDKLGQPMLNLAWSHDGHTLEGFLLPWFRERTYPGIDGRLRPNDPGPSRLYVSRDESRYESPDEGQHLDWAARYAYSGGSGDLGLSHFSGTARAPRFDLAPPILTPDGVALVPFYELIDRTGLDATLVAGGWLFKLEGIYQSSEADKFSAAGGGFEYTLTGVFGSQMDVGLLAEYLWDERGQSAPTPFNNDIFIGTRVAGNDETGMELLAGAIVDADTQARFVNVEASRRLGAGFKLALEARLFEHAPDDDPAYYFRDDDYLSLELTYFY